MKKRKIIKALVVVLILAGLSYLVFGVIQKTQQKAVIANTLKEIPQFEFKTVKDSTTFANANLRSNTTVIFIYFNSECEYCQHEAQSISDNIDKFSDVQLLFVSTESKSVITSFAKQYQLYEQNAITFLQDHANIFSERFDANTIPFLLIYDTKGELLKRHKGQLNASGILKLLNK